MAKTTKKSMEAIDSKFDEFREFVLENRELIEKILDDGYGGAREAAYASRKVAEKTREGVSMGLETAEELAFSTFRAVTSKEVQAHFVRMGLEFLQGMDALLRALPLPGVLEDAYEEASAAQTRFGETMCENNPDCLYKKKKTQPPKSASEETVGKPTKKAAPKKKLEKIELS